MQNRWRVLFVCTGNSCRSQMAEAILRHTGAARFIALSGGSRPAGYVHPLALQALEELGIPTRDLRSKAVDEFLSDPIDICITLCDSASAECPQWPDATRTAHWGVPDPAFYEGTDEQRATFCMQVARRLMRKITRLTALPLDAMSPEQITQELERLSGV